MTGSEKKSIADLIAVMAALRTPITGCPWDLDQTFASIAPYTIEEAYEVADAIERGDLADLKEELGDLLLQVVYHARMAEEQQAFDFGDVADAITTKMIRRHPHVFGDATARSAGVAKGFWEAIKAEEKIAKAARRRQLGLEPKSSGGVLGDVPASMPALTRAVKLQDKAASVGFDWPSLAPVFDKLREELAELEVEIRAATDPRVATSAAGEAAALGRARIMDEFGDLMFVVANLARHLSIDPEAALRRANAKFMRRFAHIERRLAEAGRSPADSNLEEMDQLWTEAKVRERR